VVEGTVVEGTVVGSAVVAGTVVAGVVAVDELVAGIDDELSRGRGAASAATELVVLPFSVAPRTVVCARDSEAPGNTAIATAEASTKGSSARAPFGFQTRTYQEEHNSTGTGKVRKVHLRKTSSRRHSSGPIHLG